MAQTCLTCLGDLDADGECPFCRRYAAVMGERLGTEGDYGNE